MSNTSIDTETIKHIAELAMITLTDEELKKYQKQIAAILEYVKKLAEVETEDITYKSHIDLVNVLREDASVPSLSQEAATQNRKDSQVQGFFKINMVLPADE
jgi:aspartyl-tRNA(Asn)/glutamyl-tRNA(Gln) amidotransferase subunit C